MSKDRPSVTEATQVLGGEKRGAADVTHGAGLMDRTVGESHLCAECLAGILHHEEMVGRSNTHNRLHIGTLAEEVDWQDDFSAGSHGGLQFGYIHAECVGADIHEHGLESERGDDLDSGHEGEGHGDNLVAWLEPQRHEGQLEGIGAAGAGHGMRHTRVGSQCRSKVRHCRPVDVAGLREHTTHRLINLFPYVCILTLQVNHLDRFHNP